MFMCVCVVCQFTREAHFTGEGYLGLNMDNVLNPDNFYAGIGFRTDQQNGLMFYHQGQVQITVWHIKSYFVYVNFNVKLCLFLSPQSDRCQVVLDSGHVVVSTDKNGVRSQKTYNDDNSHYVAFYRIGDGYTTLRLILISAVKWLIASKIKYFVYIIYVCVLCIFIMYIYKYTHTYSIYLENIYMCIYIYILIFYIIYI